MMNFLDVVAAVGDGLGQSGFARDVAEIGRTPAPADQSTAEQRAAVSLRRSFLAQRFRKSVNSPSGGFCNLSSSAFSRCASAAGRRCDTPASGCSARPRCAAAVCTARSSSATARRSASLRTAASPPRSAPPGNPAAARAARSKCAAASVLLPLRCEDLRDLIFGHRIGRIQRQFGLELLARLLERRGIVRLHAAARGPAGNAD